MKKTLQIADEKLSHIYVAGDVADIDGGPKNGHAATMQAMLVSNNIVRAIKSKTLLDYRVNSLIEGGIELTLGLVSNLNLFRSLEDAYFLRKTMSYTSLMVRETL